MWVRVLWVALVTLAALGVPVAVVVVEPGSSPVEATHRTYYSAQDRMVQNGRWPLHRVERRAGGRGHRVRRIRADHADRHEVVCEVHARQYR